MDKVIIGKKGFVGAFISLILFSIIGASFFNTSSVSALYTMSLSTSGDIVVNVAPAGNGTAIYEDELSISTTCTSGYNLAINTTESPELYLNGDSSNNTTYFSAVDGTSALVNSTNRWGYSATSDSASDVFISPSTTPTTLLTSTDTASTSPTATEINETRFVYYGVNTGNSTMSGAYSMANNGAIVYTLTMDTSCANYTFRYNANNGKADEESSPYTQELGLNSKEKLKKNTFTAPAKDQSTGKLYTFKGWNTKSDGTGTMYKDKAEVKLDAGDTLPTNNGTITLGSNVVVDLYAIWWTPTLADLTNDWGTMQDMSPEACYNSTAYNKDTSSPANTPYNASTNPNGYHTITLSDSRGKVITDDTNTTETPETYTVTKLPDGLCWMTQNLNLGRENPYGPNGDGTITLTSDDTDIPEDTTNPNNPVTTTFTLPASTTAFETTGTTAAYVLPKVYMNATYKGYYSYAAAIASTNNYTTQGQIITTSICPKNWDLPSSYQYDNLRTKAGYTNYTGASAAPYNFTYGGYKNGTSEPTNQTSTTRLWASTNYSYRYAYYTTAYGTATYSSNYKQYGESVRCVASQGKVTINYDTNGTNEYPATGYIPTQENVEVNVATVASDSGISRAGFAFNGWNTAADGSGTSIAAGAALSNLNLEPGSTITLYAQWIPQYTITYVNNCLTYINGNSLCAQSTSDTTSPQKINLDASGNGSATLAAYNKWTITGWKIKGWSTVANNSDNSNTEYRISTTYNVINANPGDGITLYAHWMPVYSIQYDGNGADNINGMGTTDATTGIKSLRHTDVMEGDSVQLLPSNFKRGGYGFAGWSTDADAVVHYADNDVSNDPKIYGPMETIEAPVFHLTGGANILTLYAVWIQSVGSMQTDITTVCNGLTIDPNNGTAGLSTVSALTDDRDGNTYAIAKLADNKCWMIENLRLADKNSNGNDIILTSQNTHNPSLPLNNSWYYKNQQGTLTTSNHLSATSDPISTNPDTAWCTTNSTACDDQSMLATNNTTLYTSNTATLISTYASGNVYSYGNYYNWYSATAGHGKYGNDYGSGYNAPGDICPAGWHLPTGKATGEFYALNIAVNSGATDSTANDKLRSYPNSFVRSGLVFGSLVDNRNLNGGYWSASGYSDDVSAYYMLLYSSNVYPGTNYSNKYYGRTVRCVGGV